MTSSLFEKYSYNLYMEGNILFAFVGITASGKTELARHVYDRHGFLYIRSLTTRQKRLGEEDYIYLSEDEFKRLINNGEILEYTNYVGNYYGKSKNDVLNSLSEKHCIYTITVDQIRNLKKFYPNTIVFHIKPEEPILEKTKERLIKRGTNSKEDIEKRLLQAEKELLEISKLVEDKIIDHEITTISSDHDLAKIEIDNIINRLVNY